MTTLKELADAISNDWVGMNTGAFISDESAVSSWNTGMCSRVTCKGELATEGEKPEFDGPNLFYFAGWVVDGELVPTGVVVQLHDSYGGIGLKVDVIGEYAGCGLHFQCGSNSRVPVEETVRTIRGLVETACRKISRTLAEHGVAIDPVGEFDYADVQEWTSRGGSADSVSEESDKEADRHSTDGVCRVMTAKEFFGEGEVEDKLMTAKEFFGDD